MLSPSTTPRLLAALAGLGTLALAGPAAAVPVMSSDLQITYRFVEDDGSSGTELLQNDLNFYVNQARCQCGEQIEARIFLGAPSDGVWDNDFVRTFVGTQCGAGQDSVGAMTRPCAKLLDAQPLDYNDTISTSFDAVWLSSRVPDLTDQSPETASPIDPCGGNQSGEAGIWICAEDGMQTDCQSSEFIIQGTQNQNGTNATQNDPNATGGGGIVFDYQPPQDTITGFAASPGDGAVVIRWDSTTSAQINGFRVLCADLEGNPVLGGASAPPRSAATDGNLYYTASNLCPGEIKYEVEDTTDSGTDDGDSGTTGGDEGTTGSDESTGGDGTTGAQLDPLIGDGWGYGGTAVGTTGDGNGSGSDTGTGGSSTGGSDSGTSGDGSSSGSDTGSSDTGSSGSGSVADSPLSSLDWAYVCSEHISTTGTEARVEGLQNGVEYQFIVVAYDRAGNPTIVSPEVMYETPEETTDFWEQCEAQGDLCGTGGFCHCRSDESNPAAWLGTGLLLLVMAGLRRRGNR